MTATITTPGIKLDMTVSGTTTTDFSFAFAGSIHSFTVNVPRKLYEGAKQVIRGKASGYGVTRQQLEQKYFEKFALDTEQNEFYAVLLDTFQQIKREKDLSDDEFVELLCAFVQSIPYDYKKLKRDAHPQHHCFSCETVAEGTGLCADKSLLLCGLLQAAGYGAALICFFENQHALAGVAVPQGTGHNGSDYAIIETTSQNCMVGENPGSLTKGNMTIYPIGNGTKKYLNLEENQNLKKRRQTITQSLKRIKPRILQQKSKSGKQSRKAIDDYNKAVRIIDNLDTRAVDTRTVKHLIEIAEIFLKQAEEALA